MALVEEIKNILAEPESFWLERKSSASGLDDIKRTICALANDLPDRRAPGYVVIGVDDKTGRPSGLRVDDKLMQALGGIRAEGNILPWPELTVHQIAVDGADVAVIRVLPSQALPVRFKGSVWVRVSSRTERASQAEETRLTERDIAAALPFDRRPCRSATLEDLDLEAFLIGYLPKVIAPDILREKHRSAEYRLASLRMFDLHARVPTHAGILAFGRDPQHFLPGAYVQYVRYDGVSRADRVLDSKTIQGRIQEQMLMLDALLPIQIQTPRIPSMGLRHQDQPDYPLASIREFVLNAIMHRMYENTNAPVQVYWYTDRLEITNPGGLYGNVTPANYLDVNEYRNPGVAEILKGLGYVERFGGGIVRAQAALARNDNPQAQFTFTAEQVRVTIQHTHRRIDAAAKELREPPDSPVVPDPSRALEPPGAAPDDLEDEGREGHEEQ